MKDYIPGPIIFKLVIADVDGTLLNSSHELTNFTRTTLLALQQRGIKFTLATGKILPSISNIVDALALDQPLILANGALVQQANKTILYETPLPPQHFLALLDFVRASGLDYALFMRDQVFVPRHTYNTTLVVEYNDPQPIEIGQINIMDKTFCKLIVLERNDTGQLDRLGSMLNEKFKGILKAYRSVPGMLEVFNAQTSKSVAVQKVATHLGLDMQQVIVIGDSYNDIDMFKIAGVAVAMGNAPDDVKREAQITIGTNDEDGLAHYISKFFAHLFL
jgi:Cof subfamily protein (haloacid dehalogenase superfamily)